MRINKMFACLCVILFSLNTFGQLKEYAGLYTIASLSYPERRTAEIKRLPNGYVPTIDGISDNIWNYVEPHAVDRNFIGETPTLNTATWKAVWNDTAIYVIVEVSDNNFDPYWISGIAEWQSDKFELYFDVNDTLYDSLGASSGLGHYQIAPDFSQFDTGTIHFYSGAYVADRWHADPAKYVYEYRVPFAALMDKHGLALDPVNRPEIGYDVYVVDLDTGQTSRNRKVWANTGAEDDNWGNMDSAGIIKFIPDEIATPVEVPFNLTGKTESRNNVFLRWNSDNDFFSDGFETGNLSSWNVIQGSGTAGYEGHAYWYVQDSAKYAYEGNHSALTNWGIDINTWLIAPPVHVTGQTIVSFNWSSSYTVNVADNTGNLFLKISQDGGDTWGTSIWSFADIGVWDDWLWNKATVSLSAYQGKDIVLAFNIVADSNTNILLDNVYIGDNSLIMANGNSIKARASKDGINSDVGNESVPLSLPNVKEQSKFVGYAVYRNGSKITETTAKTYADLNLPAGLYNYHIIAMYNTPDTLSGKSNEIEMIIEPSSIQTSLISTSDDILVYPVPAYNILNVVMKDLTGIIELKVYDMTGKEVYSGTINCLFQEQVNVIDVGKFSSGIYFLKANDQIKTCTTKFTIE
jgi:hypothetical protein